LYCSLNGYLQARRLMVLHAYPEEWLTQPRFLIGSVIFVVGFIMNNVADYVLRNLRKPGQTSYQIPYGAGFGYVSAANYFWELVEWWGFCIACWSYSALSFAFFSMCNLVPRAWQVHHFYRNKFEDYPPNRKAVIPFIF